MQEKHDVPMAKHRGEITTRMAIRKRLYWPKMKQDVEHFVRTCVKCQNTKSIYKKKYGLYKPLPIPSEPWENVSMDFMTPTAQVEWGGHHIHGNQLILQVGKDGSNYNNRHNF